MSMSRVQELIDERRSELPVVLAMELLEACREEASARPQLYRVSMTKIQAKADGCDPTLDVGATKTVIAEAIRGMADSSDARKLLHLEVEAAFHPKWLQESKPIMIHDHDELCVSFTTLNRTSRSARVTERVHQWYCKKLEVDRVTCV